MKTKIENTLLQYKSKIMGITYYHPAETVRNDWVGNIKNCIAWIEILLDGADEITYTLRYAGFTVQKVGRDLYITI